MSDTTATTANAATAAGAGATAPAANATSNGSAGATAANATSNAATATTGTGAPTTVLLCGVGGQGTILAADLLARAALEAGFEVKVSEIHGMAQRGGAVTTVVRFGDEVATMVADIGATDCIVSFETTEALRNISFLKDGGFLLVADETIKPLPVACGNDSMPQRVPARLDAYGAMLIPAHDLALEAGNAKCENVAILGALESKLGFGADTWKRVIEGRVPEKTIDANLKAFELGLEFAHAN